MEEFLAATSAEVPDPDEDNRRVVYRRLEGDERMCPFIPELSYARISHGAHCVPSTSIAAAYMNKYYFKASGAVGGDSVNITSDILDSRHGKSQLLREVPDEDLLDAMRESVRCRKVSMMEIGLHLTGEGLTWSNFHVRQIWPILPMDKKKFIVNGAVKEGVLGGGDYQQYLHRKPIDHDLYMEAFFSQASVSFRADKTDGVITNPSRSGPVAISPARSSLQHQTQTEMENYLRIDGEPKLCMTRVQLVRGEGRKLMELCS